MKSPHHLRQPINWLWLIGTILIFGLFSTVIVVLLPHRTLTSPIYGDGKYFDFYIEATTSDPFSEDLIHKIRSVKHVDEAAEIYSPVSKNKSIKNNDEAIHIYSANPATITKVTSIRGFNPQPGYMNVNKYSSTYVNDDNTITLHTESGEYVFAADYNKAIRDREFYIHLDDLKRIFGDIYTRRIVIKIEPNLSSFSLLETIDDLEKAIGHRRLNGDIIRTKNAMTLHYKLIYVCFALGWPLFLFPIFWVGRRAKRLTEAYRVAIADGTLPVLPRETLKHEIWVAALSVPLVGVFLGIVTPITVFTLPKYLAGEYSLRDLMFQPVPELGLFLLISALVLWVVALIMANRLDIPFAKGSNPFPKR